QMADSLTGHGRILQVDSGGVVSDFVTDIDGDASGLAFADSTALYFNLSRTPYSSGPGAHRLYRVTRQPSTSVPGNGVSASPAFRVGTPAPNPFMTTSRLEYDLPAAAWVRIDVFDPTGRLVRSLGNRHEAAGAHVVQWDGRDTAGRRVASGAY